jgi:hypothetical protein
MNKEEIKKINKDKLEDGHMMNIENILKLLKCN